MVEGKFHKKTWVSVVLLLVGLFLIVMFVLAKIADADANILPGIIPSALLSCWGLVLFLFNRKAFIHIDETHMSARYHWRGKLKCDLCDIAFAFGEMNGLTILLKNGKRHSIMGVENSYTLCRTLRRAIPFEATEKPEAIFTKLRTLQASRKKEIIYVCVGVALLFINLFITVYLTGERELYEFSKTDWTVMAIMGVVELFTIAETFYMASRSGKKRYSIEHVRYTLKRTLIETYPLPSGNVRHVYTDERYDARLTILGFPNDNSIYYVVEHPCWGQQPDADCILETVYTSEIYPDEASLPEGLDQLIEITEKFFTAVV